MILTYSLPRFKEAILEGRKIHTIRADRLHRWKPGMAIDHWMHSPRNPSKNPHKFEEGLCISVQDIVIQRVHESPSPKVFVMAEKDGRVLLTQEVAELAKNEGLTLDEFREWFVPESNPVFRGRIIHFTDKKY